MKKIIVFVLFVALSFLPDAARAEQAEQVEEVVKMSAWDTFFMLLMVIPTSKMLSSIFMKLVARVGTIDEHQYALMGLGGLYKVGKTATKALQWKYSGASASGDSGLNGGFSGFGGPSGTEPPGGSGGSSPVAGPVVAGIMAGATKVIANPVTTMGGIGYGVGKRAMELRGGGMSMRDALSSSAKEFTGASTTSEANARIIGSILGSPFGTTGAKFGEKHLGKAASWANKTF